MSNQQEQANNVAAAAEIKTPEVKKASLGGSLLSENAERVQPYIDAKMEAEKAKPSDVPNDNKDPVWYYEDGKPGVGPRPASLPSKFKSFSDLGKSYNELEKKLGAFKAAPEQYDFKFAEAVTKETGFKLEPEHPDMKEFLDLAKKSNASQEIVENILKRYAQMQVRNMPNPKKELERLGDAGPVIQKRLEQWFANKLTKEEYALVRNSITTADMALIFDKLRSSSTINPVQQPTTAAASAPTNVSTPNDVQQEIVANYARYSKDPTYRKEMVARLQQAIDNSPIEDA